MKEAVKKLLEHAIMKKLVFAIEFFTTKRVITAASALTYSTILSFVPICAVVFAIARGFGFTKYIEEWFRNLLSSQPQAAELLIGFVNSYLEHAKSGIILGIGLVFMLYTVVMLTRNVEQTFNDIWHVSDRKDIMQTFTDYLAIFFLSPIVIIIMSGISLFVTRMVSQSGWDEPLGPAMQVVVEFVPFVLMWFVFTALYVFMPNTNVKLRFAIIPAFLASVAMYLLQWFYINAQMFISSYNAIYGSFAALPLFMLWIQLSWTICLFGAELCYTNQNLEDFVFANGASEISHRHKLLLTIVLLSKICRRFAEGGKAYSATELKVDTGIPLSITRDLLYNLVTVDLLTEIVGKNNSLETQFQPAKALEMITVGDVIDRIESNGVLKIPIDLNEQFNNDSLIQKIKNLRKRYIADLGEISLKDF